MNQDLSIINLLLHASFVVQLVVALLDIATIIVLGSGLYLWLKRGNTVPSASRKAKEHEERQPAEPVGVAQPEPAAALKGQA